MPEPRLEQPDPRGSERFGDAWFLGLDFGTLSVRAIIVDGRGRVIGSASDDYAHGQITPGSDAAARFFSDPLPLHFALQHPGDWIDSAASAIRSMMREIDAGGRRLAGIGVDFTSCTMLPATRDGTPLCMVDDQLARRPHAWPKLWKHHGAIRPTERLNALAQQRCEPWLQRYGGVIGLEWFFPKILEVIDNDPEVAQRAEVWLEAGDWFVWRLVGGDAESIPRSTCQAGYKALWSRGDGYAGSESSAAGFLAAGHPLLAEAAERRMPGRLLAPGTAAGTLAREMAQRLGLPPGVPVSAAIIDAHAGVPGAGIAEAGALVMVLGTSGCHMLMDESDHVVPGVAGVVEDGILPGYFGYETGQAAMGDAFDWVRRLCGFDDFGRLDQLARSVPPGSDGLTALDWFNGCRTPLMDGTLAAAITGLALHHGPGHLYRAVLESSAMGTRWIVDTLREGGVAVNRFVATGGLPHHNPLFVEIVASALGSEIEVHGSAHGPALGAAILGACAAGVFDSSAQAVRLMAGADSEQPPSHIVHPQADAAVEYDVLYRRYRALAEVVRGSNRCR